jgi:N-acetylglucosaminyl-diphospho-decaprenol L-rhamnosyltransferase
MKASVDTPRAVTTLPGNRPAGQLVDVLYSVVIVNFNADEHLNTALKSVGENLPHAAWDAAVVENGRGERSTAAVSGWENVRLLRNADNVGYAKAVNQGLALTKGSLVLVMNPDCQLLPGAITTMAQAIAAHPDCAIVGPCVLNVDGTIQGSARGDPGMMTGLFGRSSLLTRIFPNVRSARANVRAEELVMSRQPAPAVDWVSGACMLIRREALERVSGFDDRYFLYWEDADLCRRLREAGYSVRYVPGARAVHLVGASSRTVQRLALRAFHRSAYTYYSRHVVRSPWHPARPLAWLLLRVRCGWKLLMSFSGRESRDVSRA